MALSNNYIQTIKEIQNNNPELSLCGSVALIFRDILPYREVHDIDFVINQKHFDDSNLWMKTNSYPTSEHDEYSSYEIIQNGLIVNVLVFEDHVKLNHHTNDGIKYQDLNDIISWKRKYNRQKDIDDLNNMNKAFEEAIFGG